MLIDIGHANVAYFEVLEPIGILICGATDGTVDGSEGSQDQVVCAIHLIAFIAWFLWKVSFNIWEISMAQHQWGT